MYNARIGKIKVRGFRLIVNNKVVSLAPGIPHHKPPVIPQKYINFHNIFSENISNQ